MERIIVIIWAVLMCGIVQAQHHRGRGHVHAKHARVYHHHHPAKHKVVFHRRNVVVVRPRRVHSVAVLPTGATAIVFRGNSYYLNNGFYYTTFQGSYRVVAAPFGIRVRILPIRFAPVVVSGTTYYYSQGTYYQSVQNEYEVVNPPVGAIVPELPEYNVEKITLNDQTYFEYDSVLYKEVPTESGVQYQVVGKLED